MSCRRRGELMHGVSLVGVKRELTPADLKAVLSGMSAGFILTCRMGTSPIGWPSC
jgi:hypothetical protein